MVWLIIAQLLVVLTLVPWLYVAALGALELQSNDPAAGRALPVVVLLYPLVPVVCSVAAWLLYRRQRLLAAALTMPLPIGLMLAGLYLLYGNKG